MAEDAEATSSPAPALGVVAAAVLCVVVPLGLVVQTPSPLADDWWLAVAVIVGAGLRYALLIARGQQRLYELMAWLFVYVFLGLAPLVQLRTGATPGTTPIVALYLNRAALWLVLGGAVALAAGMGLRDRLKRRVEAREARPVSRKRVDALSVAGFAAAAYYVHGVGLGPLFDSRAALAQAADVAWPDATRAALVYSVTAMSLLVAAVAGITDVRAARRAGEDVRRRARVVAGTAVVLLLVVNPISSPRYVVGTVYLALLAAVGAFATPRRFRQAAAGALAGLLLVFPLADAFRYSSSAELEAGGPVAALQSADFDAFAQINNTLLYVDQVGVTWGRQAAGVVLFWVPRTIWPDKPVDTGILLAEHMGYRVTNLSAPLWAELFINGGWVLLLAGMAAFGWALRHWDLAGLDRLRRGVPLGPAAAVLPFYLLIVLRGSLLQAMANLAVVLVAAWFVTRRQTEPEPEPVSSTAASAPPR